MKRSIAAMLLIILCSAYMAAADVDKLFDEFKNTENTEYVKVPRLLMWIVKLTEATDNDPITKKVSSMQVLDFSKCDTTVKKQFSTRYRQLAKSMDEVLRVREGDDAVSILTEKKGDKYHNFYIFATDSTDCAFVKLSGTFSENDLKAAIKYADKD